MKMADSERLSAVLFSGRVGGRKLEVRAVQTFETTAEAGGGEHMLSRQNSRCVPLPDGVLVETVLPSLEAGGRVTFRVRSRFGGVLHRTAWMVDADGNCSDRVLVERRRGMGGDTVSLVPDVGWLRDTGRSYPVVLQLGLRSARSDLLLFDSDAGNPDGTVAVDGDGVPVRICRGSGQRQKRDRVLRVTLPCLNFPLSPRDGAYRLCLCRTNVLSPLSGPLPVVAVGSPDGEEGDCMPEVPEKLLSGAAAEGFRLRLCREEKTGYFPAPSGCETAIRLPSGTAVPMTRKRREHGSDAILSCGTLGPFGAYGIHPGTGAFEMRLKDGFADPALSLPVRLCYSSADRDCTERNRRVGSLGHGWRLEPERNGFWGWLSLCRRYRIGRSGRRITSLTDRSGQSWLPDYREGRLVSLTAPNGGKTELLYETVQAGNRPELRLCGVAYPNGAAVGITYCADVPSTVTLSGPNIGRAPTTRLEWDGHRRVRRIDTVSPDAKQEKNVCGAPRPVPAACIAFRYLPVGTAVCRYETDESGRTVCISRTVWHPGDRIPPVDLSAATEPLGQMPEYRGVVRDPSGRICEAEVPGGGSLVCRYNGFGDLVRLMRGDGQTVTLYEDAFRNRTGIALGRTQLADYTYRPETNRLLRAHYANGQSVSFDYDSRGNLSQVEESCEDGASACVETNVYDARNRLICRTDRKNGRRTERMYDGERVTEYRETADGDGENRMLFGIRYQYDACGALRGKRYLLPGGVKWTDRDSIRRALKPAAAGDSLMDPDPTSRRDGYGNLLLRNGVIFRYGDTERHDLLTDYGDVPIPHDAVGNPLELCGQKLGWERGTRLVSFGKNAYRYRSDGLRIEKSENGRRHRYFYDGDRLVAEQIGNAYSGDILRLLLFLYDRNGTVCGFRDGAAEYRLLRNPAGDVVALLDAKGNALARYAYDPFGEVLSITDANGRRVLSSDHPGNLNPFRFRGYFYDTETGWYCIRGRYYYPRFGRYLSPDVDGLAGLRAFPRKWNLFAL